MSMRSKLVASNAPLPQGLVVTMPLILSWPSPPHANTVIDTLTAMLTTPGDIVKDFDHRRCFPESGHVTRVIIHWPDAIFWDNPPINKLFVRIIRVLFHLSILKSRGAYLIRIVHNIQPHDIKSYHIPLWQLYSNMLNRLTNGWLTLAPSTGAAVVKAFPALKRRPHSFIWHPSYRWHSPIARLQAREMLKYAESEIIFAHIGFLRPYKGIDDFLCKFILSNVPSTRLLIAGKPSSQEFGENIAAMAVSDDRVDVVQNYIDSQAYNIYLEAVDVFVAPYRNFLHSGALVHALSRRCVVVAPNGPFTNDLAMAVGEEWVVAFDQVPTTDDIEAACARVRALRNSRPDLTALDPEKNIDTVREFLAALDEMG